MVDLKNYKYYKGEAENPYQNKDFGKAFWWKVEKYAAQRNDDKERDMLSMTMVNYLSIMKLLLLILLILLEQIRNLILLQA